MVVQSAVSSERNEDRVYHYTPDGLLEKVSQLATVTTKLSIDYPVSLRIGEEFAYTRYEYNAQKQLVKSSRFVKYSNSEEYNVYDNFATPDFYVTYQYDANGNAISRSYHNIGYNEEVFKSEAQLTFDNKKNPLFYSFLFDDDIAIANAPKNNITSWRERFNFGELSDLHRDYTYEYDSTGFPVKRTMVEAGGYINTPKTTVQTYTYQMR